MMERLAIWRSNFYEGHDSSVRRIHPMPVISPVSCEFISVTSGQEVIFREDSFDPVTRLRRGRLYISGRNADLKWGQVTVDNADTYDWGNIRPSASYVCWQPGEKPEDIIGRHLHIGEGDFKTKWRVLWAEKITIGQVLLTLRAHSLFGVVPELMDTITDNSGSPVNSRQVKMQLDTLVDAFHRQQPTPTVDVARETARVILTAWFGNGAKGKDLHDVIRIVEKNQENRKLVIWASSIINRLHPRGKSAEHETQASRGVELRHISEQDAEASLHLVGLLLRELGWAAP